MGELAYRGPLSVAHDHNTDPISYLPSVGQWLIGLFLAVMLFVTGRGLLQLLNLIWLAGLLTLAAVF